MILSACYPPKPDTSLPKELSALRDIDVKAKIQEDLNKGFILPLRSTLDQGYSIVERYERLNTEFRFRGKTYVKAGAFQIDGEFYAHYQRKNSNFDPTMLVSKVPVTHVRLIAEYWFGVTYAGLDSYLAEFGRFIGVYLDSNNMCDYLYAFAAYLSKELEVSPSVLRIVIKHIMHLK